MTVAVVRVAGGGSVRWPDVVPALVDAFWDYPETVHLLPAERNRRRVLPRYLGSDVRDASRPEVGAVDAAIDGGRVVGAAAWVRPSGYPIGMRRQLREAIGLVRVAPWGVGALREARRGQAANRDEHRRHPPHLWLRVLGVARTHQRSGVGEALLGPGLAEADASGVGCFLFTAAEANVAWYRRFGFEEGAPFRPTPTWPTVWAMWRPPTVSSGCSGSSP
jgi:ribosomal protein S18 acetylase RimI-like enzyme